MLTFKMEASVPFLISHASIKIKLNYFQPFQNSIIWVIFRLKSYTQIHVSRQNHSTEFWTWFYSQYMHLSFISTYSSQYRNVSHTLQTSSRFWMSSQNVSPPASIKLQNLGENYSSEKQFIYQKLIPPSKY